ncbi:MAG: porin family protein [Puia sp.]|nr:porin family protein [Puia sp.]
MKQSTCKSTLLLLFSGLFITTRAQDIQLGAEGGLNVSGAHATEPGVVFHGSPGIRFSVGGFADLALPDRRFSVRPKLLFSRESYSPVLFGDKTPVTISYINIPIPLIYHSTLKDKKIFFGLGPYFGYALSGKYVSQGVTTKIAWGNDPAKDDGKRLDIGADFLAGYQLNKEIALTAKFDWGIKDISAEPSFYKVHTLNLGLTASYLLFSRSK